MLVSMEASSWSTSLVAPGIYSGAASVECLPEPCPRLALTFGAEAMAQHGVWSEGPLHLSAPEPIGYG
jgi:hypothetical protein